MSPDGHRPPGRVVVVGHSRFGSGAERVLLRYVDAMLSRSWPVDAICPDGFLDRELRARGIEPTIIPELQLPTGPTTVARGRLVARWLRAALTARRAVDDHAIIVVNGLLALPAVRLAGLTGRSAWLVHDVVVRPDLQSLARRSIGGLRGAIAVSRAAGEFPTEHGVPTTVVRNGTPWPIEPAPLRSTGRPVVGINAMVTLWKGHHVLLEAAAGLPGIDVEIMGGRFPKDGTYVEQLRRRASAADLDGRVRFLGHVDDPLDAMRSWWVAVSASVDPEAGPLAILEAMSLGLPVVASNHGGAAEVVDEAGLLVAPGDADELQRALALLTTDHERRRSCAAAGRAAVAARLTAEASNEAFLDAIEDLTAVDRAQA